MCRTRFSLRDRPVRANPMSLPQPRTGQDGHSASFRSGFGFGFTPPAAALALLLAAAMPAGAQTSACEELKSRLALRLSGGPGSYVMEAVPAATEVPAGFKVIGTCGGGAWKVLFRRGSAPLDLATVAAPAGATGAAPGTAVTADSAAATARPTPPAVRAEAPPTDKPSERSNPKDPPVRDRAEALAGGTRLAATAPATAMPAATLRAEDARRAAAGPQPMPAPVATSEPATERVPSPEPDAQLAAATRDEATGQQGVSAFVQRHGLWLGLLAVLPLAAWLYAWIARRRDYDEQGLPRGPRLN